MLTRAPSAQQSPKARTSPKPRPRSKSCAALSFQADSRASRTAILFLFAAALCAALSSVRAFAQAQRAEAPATVAGRVTDGEHGLAGVAVVLVSSEQVSPPRTVAHAKTDAEGGYRIMGVPPGRYKIIPFSPTYIVQGLSMYDYPPGKPLNLSAGESVEGIDFRLERGGVITGRVTDADGNPVVGEQVSVVPYAGNEQQRQMLQQQQQRGPFDVRDYATDDRGVYRIYGLLPGTYHVSVGQDGGGGALSYGRRKLYRRTFYNGVTEESQASTVEVTAGGETSDIDITLGKAVKTFRASGRFVSAETGQPVANVSYGYGPVRADGRLGGGFGGGFMTNERGEFQAEGLAPGRYTIFDASFGLAQNNAGELYSDPVTFEVVDSDVTGIVVKLRRGASVSGVVTIEGVADPATAARLLKGVTLYGVPQPTNQATTVPNVSRSLSVAADGSFRLAGLHPGKLRIFLNGATKGLTLARVELNGANVTNGLEVAEGAQVSGVRVVVASGSGVLRGQVNFTNGTAPQGARVYVFARRAGAEEQNSGWAEADARGRFVMENLPAGEYEVQARVMAFQPGTRPAMSEPQHLSLGEGGDMSVTLTVDMNAPPKGGRP
ncbi:MAG TPA: carboxypeptidase-like regulatory domain-containing protein [Pyrinomonadaceae bacterium]|nr:carboxypeptidase-like regulatory domain-containing protein [Pyrinomonadaceae bacterium]